MIALVCVACNQKETPILTQDGSEAAQSQQLILSAYSAESSATRTSRDDEGTFYWSPGDQISLFYGSGSEGGSPFTATCSEAAQITDFSGTINVVTGNLGEESERPKFWGIYPYNTVNECDGTTLVTAVPSQQTAAAETFADGQFISIGCSEGLSMGFYHLCGGIKVFLQEEGIVRMSLTGNAGETLAGTVEVVLDEDGHPVVQKVKTAKREVVLTPPSGEDSFRTGVNYFFVTLPVTFSKGFTVAFEKADGTYGVRSISVQMTVNRSKFQWSESAIETGVEFVTPGSYSDPEYQDIMLPGVRAYLEEVDYSDDFELYEKSYIQQYSGGDTPAPVYISYSGTASSIELSTILSFDSEVQSVSASTSPASVYNLVPGVQYDYRVLTGGGLVLKEGSVIPVGPLRMIKANRTRNFRDLGGWSAEDGKTIAYGKLYRGTQTSTSDRSVFNSLGIGVDLDLRGNGGGSASQVFSDLEYRNIQVYQFMYNGGNEGYTQELYQEALHYVIDRLNAGKVVFFHCIGGADRTGTLAFLIEALLGVSENDLSKDYELTTYYSTRLRNDTGNRPFKQLVFYLKTFPGETLQEKVTNWATTQLSDQVAPITLEEIALLKSLLLQ